MPMTPLACSLPVRRGSLLSRPASRAECERVQRRELELIPIDHSNSLPDTLEIAYCDWIWVEWPQSKLALDAETRAYVEGLDVEADIAMLREHLSIREECLRLFRVTNTLLKLGVRQGLTLHEIASIITRQDIDIPSELEVACTQAAALAEALQSAAAGAGGVTNSVPLSEDNDSDDDDNMDDGGDMDTLGAATGGSTLKKLGLRRSMSCNNLPAVQVNKLGFGIREAFAKAGQSLNRKTVGYSPPIKPQSSKSGVQALELGRSTSLVDAGVEGEVDPAYEKLYFACVRKLMQSLVERKLLARNDSAKGNRRKSVHGLGSKRGWPITQSPVLEPCGIMPV